MSLHRLLVSSVAIASLLAMQGVVAQIYSWKDANGRTHYSDQPPPDSKTQVTNKPAARPGPPSDSSKSSTASGGDKEKAASGDKSAAGQSSPAASQSGPKTWQERDLEYKQKQAADKEAEAKRKAEADKADEKRRHCESLRGNLAMLQKGGRVAKLDANGERVFMEDEQMAREAERVRAQIARDCN
ncbi:DUF4124 domain-containing protein [Viridibacterium curvum]|uniref:DUF4124 domain-containing protein n=1 Tax=Viridibacterium curvum TaxID=1101404 RepID=A0ABP9QAG1_9RHOO